MKIFFVFWLFAANVLFARESYTENLQKVSVQLHWKYQFEFAGFIAAKEKGFYQDAGLDVDLKEYQFGTNIVDDVLTKKSTYGVYNSNILIEYLQNKKIALLSSYFKRAALVIITKPYIKSPSDLAGKTIMAAGKEDFDFNFRPLFDGYHIDTNRLHFVKHTYNVEDFIQNKNVDAMTAFISDQPYKLDRLGYKYHIINPSDYGAFNLQLELFTSQDELLNHQLRTKKFRDATTKGWEYALAHQDEIVNIIHTKYAPQLSKEDLKEEAKEITKLILPYTYSIGSIDKNFLNRQMEIFKTNYHIVSDKTIDDFLFNSTENLPLNLTQTEVDYLTKHNNIKVCVRADQFPYDGYTEHAYTGVMADIFKIVAKDLDIKFTPIVSESSQELSLKLQKNECQLVSLVPTVNNPFLDISPTKPLIRSYFTLIGKLDKSFIQDPSMLREKKLLVQFPSYKQHLLKLYPYLDIRVEPDTNKMIKKLLADEVFAVVDLDLKADYLVDNYGYGKLKINGFLAKEKSIDLSMGVQKDQLILFSILQKELASISTKQIDNIENNWRLTRYQEKTDYGLVIKILFSLGFIISLMAYYQKKLRKFNSKLAKQVQLKTQELRAINHSLEKTVHEKIEELIQKDKLLGVQSKQAVMGEMISMIAHQWRQPLSMITLQISNLQIKKMIGTLEGEDEYDKTLTKISDTIIYLSETIDDFQTYFRPDRKLTIVEIHELLLKAINFASPRARENSIEIIVQKEKEIYAKVYASELIQVVLNLVNNAIDALTEISRDKKFIHLHVRIDKDILYIDIKDNGIGILAENMEKLFEPYFSTKGKNGTGLGLYMSKMIIEKQFLGHIDVQSSVEGTHFIIRMPKHEI